MKGKVRRCRKRYKSRCRKVCWGVGEVRGVVGKGEGSEEMWESVLRFHTLTPFIKPPPFLSPHANTLPHSPHTGILSHTPPHTSFLASPHISSHSSPHFPLHPNTLPHSPHALSHIFPHSFDYVAKLPCDDVTLINLTGKAR